MKLPSSSHNCAISCQTANMDTHNSEPILKSFSKGERLLLKALLVCHLYHVLYETTRIKLAEEPSNPHLTMECYIMDAKIIQVIIREILESEQYTLEGIACYTRIPLDIVVDAACGNNCHLSITSWTRIVVLYLEVRPELSKKFFNRIAAMNGEERVIQALLLEDC